MTFNKGSQKSEEIMDAGMLPRAYTFPWQISAGKQPYELNKQEAERNMDTVFTSQLLFPCHKKTISELN